MKIAYLHCSIHTPGGMERVMLNKAEWLAAHGYEVLVVTTDQRGRAPFFPLPAGVRHIDLSINYTDYRELSVWQKIKGYLPKRRLHRQRLETLLATEHPDVVVSLYPSESSFIPSLKDGSKKVLELHQNRFFRIQYNNPGLYGVIDRLRSIQDRSIVERFDRFVVLTNEDKGLWGDLHNMVVIPNAAKMQPTAQPMPEKRFIAVGRLDYQKSFDRLLQAWTQALADDKHSDWHLDIYGQGEWHDMLINMIEQAGIGSNTHIHPPTTDIATEYARSAALVMTSHYEGFPMVMVEAMACGVPVLTFDYRCGPRDIIRDGDNGLIVSDGDIDGMANAMRRIMDDEQLQRHMAQQARMVTDTYAEDKVMHQWVSLFEELMHEKTTAD